MPTSIPFSVAPAPRGTPNGEVFTSNTVAYVSGYNTIDWSLDIPNQAEYENTGNSVKTELLQNGQVIGDSTWFGGRVETVDKQGNPVVNPVPRVGFSLANIVPGQLLQVRVTVVGPAPWSVGILNGLIQG